MDKTQFSTELSALLQRAMPEAGVPADGAVTLSVHVWSRALARAAYKSLAERGFSVDIRETARGATLEVWL